MSQEEKGYDRLDEKLDELLAEVRWRGDETVVSPELDATFVELCNSANVPNSFHPERLDELEKELLRRLRFKTLGE